MKLKLQKIALLLSTSTVLLLAAQFAGAQDATKTPKRLRSPANVKGFIGGESHDTYSIRVNKGRTMTVRISWKREGDNRAEFTITESDKSVSGEPVAFGKKSDKGRRWTGKIPRTGNYYISVTGYPSAHYLLKVNVN
jgi:hypothetical protein